MHMNTHIERESAKTRTPFFREEIKQLKFLITKLRVDNENENDEIEFLFVCKKFAF